MKTANALPRFPHEPAEQPLNDGWLCVLEIICTANQMKTPAECKLTMYCKCQLDHLIPLKCVCVKFIVWQFGKSRRGVNEILSGL